MKLIRYVLMVAIIVLAGCRDNPEFRLEAVSDDIGTQNVTIRYVDRNGAYRIDQVPAVNGSFSYVGTTDGPTYVEVFDSSNRLLGEFIAKGGDNIKARFAIANPENISIEGNDDAILLNEWLNHNRGSVMKGDSEAVNAAIEAFVRENPKQFASTALMLRYFTVAGHEQKALRLLQSIDEKYRPASKVLWFEQMLNISMEGSTAKIPQLRVFAREVTDTREDSAATFSPRGARYNLLLLTDNDSRGADSIRQMLNSITGGDNADHPRLRIVDFGCDRDTLLWGASLRNLPDDYPADIHRYWLPEGPATPGLAEAAPPAIPAFILTDSLGAILYRTPSARAMQQFFIHKKP